MFVVFPIPTYVKPVLGFKSLKVLKVLSKIYLGRNECIWVGSPIFFKCVDETCLNWQDLPDVERSGGDDPECQNVSFYLMNVLNDNDIYELTRQC